jgi:hypothetical protein
VRGECRAGYLLSVGTQYSEVCKPWVELAVGFGVGELTSSP